MFILLSTVVLPLLEWAAEPLVSFLILFLLYLRIFIDRLPTISTNRPSYESGHYPNCHVTRLSTTNALRVGSKRIPVRRTGNGGLETQMMRLESLVRYFLLFPLFIYLLLHTRLATHDYQHIEAWQWTDTATTNIAPSPNTSPTSKCHVTSLSTTNVPRVRRTGNGSDGQG